MFPAESWEAFFDSGACWLYELLDIAKFDGFVRGLSIVCMTGITGISPYVFFSGTLFLGCLPCFRRHLDLIGEECCWEPSSILFTFEHSRLWFATLLVLRLFLVFFFKIIFGVFFPKPADPKWLSSPFSCVRATFLRWNAFPWREHLEHGFGFTIPALLTGHTLLY